MAFDFNNVGSGAGTGAAVGSVVPGIGTAFGTALGGLAGGALGGFLGKDKNKETEIQKTQRQLVDELLGSLRGNGPYSDLFSANEADFERSFAEPARARFRNITTPQIQQGYIASGLQNSTGLEDTLARAGVDMDQLLNQQWMNYTQGAQNRQSNAIGNILGQGAGAMPDQTGWEGIMEGISNYAGGNFGGNLENILKAINQKKDQSQQDTIQPPRKGFEQEGGF